MQVELNFTKYDLISSDGNDITLTLVLDTNSDLDKIRTNAENHKGPIYIYEGTQIVSEYKGYERFNSIKSNGDTVLIFDQIYNYEQALIVLFGEPLSLYEAEQKKEEITVLADYAPDEIAVKNKWAYPEWAVGVSYAVDDKVNLSSNLYRCKRAHTSGEEHNPTTDTVCWYLIPETNEEVK